MEKSAKLFIDGKEIELPIIVGAEGERGIDISRLRSEMGYVTFDPGFANTSACQSAITYIDGEKGILRYRGIPIEEIAEKASFVEVAFLLIYGHLPTKEESEKLSDAFTRHSLIHEDLKHIFDGYPSTGHPMGILSAMITSLSAYYPELIKKEPSPEEIYNVAVELLSKVRTICAFAYKKSRGEPFIYPRHDLKYVPNFLNMMFSSPTRPYEMKKEVVDTLNTLLILHADHGQNCSTSAVRLVGSAGANLFASISAGICALWGPLHGGANQAVIEMLEEIRQDGGDVKKYIELAKNPKSKFRLMGFGHRIYKNFDPRAKIIKKKVHELFKTLGRYDSLLDIALELEERALKDSYFMERKLYPNVDFYSGIIYRAIGIPVNMFPVMFAIGRMPGWIAQWKEMKEDPRTKIGRPRQIYRGEIQRKYMPIGHRKSS